MKRLFSIAGALGVSLATVLLAASALASHPSVLPPPIASPDILVEGHVFDHRTGQPMRNVEVMAIGWLSVITFDPSPAVSLDSDSPELSVYLPPGGPILPPRGPSVYTDENGFYSLVLRADQFRSLSAACHIQADSERAGILPSWSSLPIYDLREVRRDFYLKTGPKRAPRPKCQRVAYPLATTVAP